MAKSISQSVRSCTYTLLTFSLLLLGAAHLPQRAEASSAAGLLILQMSGYTIFHADDMSGAAITFASTQQKCFDAGAVPASDPAATFRTRISWNLAYQDYPAGSTFYAGGSAAPTAANPNNCVSGVSSTTASPNSNNCNYRWRYGFYDAYSYMGEPGTAFFAGLYAGSDPGSQVLNSYSEMSWRSGYPKGAYYTVDSLSDNRDNLLRADMAEVPVGTADIPTSSFIVVCELQMYPELQATTTEMPQPEFVKGYKDLTWAQSHWWVIFIIVAAIILLILLIIVIFCCCTSRKEKPVEPLFQMVIRERDGKAYVIADATAERERKMPVMPPAPNPMMPPQDAAGNPMRYGRGFNPQAPVNPEDEAQGMANIYIDGGRNLYADGNAFVDENGEEMPEVTNLGADALPEPPRPPTPESEVIVDTASEVATLADDMEEVDGTSSAAPSLHSKRRGGARRGRGRTVSQTFSDVDLPQAGEISETNLDL